MARGAVACLAGPDHHAAVSLGDIAFPYRANRRFGMSSFALLFLVLLAEIEAVVFLALLLAGRGDTFLDFQPLIVPAAVLVSLTAAAVFSWRARRWTRVRMDNTRLYSTESSGYAERLAQQHRTNT